MTPSDFTPAEHLYAKRIYAFMHGNAEWNRHLSHKNYDERSPSSKLRYLVLARWFLQNKEK